MSYEKLLYEVAKLHNTTPNKVDSEIRSALIAAGVDITPQTFITLIAAKIKKDYIS